MKENQSSAFAFVPSRPNGATKTAIAWSLRVSGGERGAVY